VAREFGALDILINNAAVCFNDPTLYGTVPHTPFERQAGTTVRVNFFGTLSVIREFLPLLRASPSPRLVTYGSSAGRLSILRSQTKIELFTAPSLTVAQLEEQVRKTPSWPRSSGQLQPFIAVFLQKCVGQLVSFGPT
jgi:carbonyl reductase 1